MRLVHLYADDTVVCCHANCFALVFDCLQAAFDIIRSILFYLALVLNTDKYKGY